MTNKKTLGQSNTTIDSANTANLTSTIRFNPEIFLKLGKINKARIKIINLVLNENIIYGGLTTDIIIKNINDGSEELFEKLVLNDGDLTTLIDNELGLLERELDFFIALQTIKGSK